MAQVRRYPVRVRDIVHVQLGNVGALLEQQRQGLPDSASRPQHSNPEALPAAKRGVQVSCEAVHAAFHGGRRHPGRAPRSGMKQWALLVPPALAGGRLQRVPPCTCSTGGRAQASD
eukprot:scaffold4768_cov412-Prasinococcus_capsulatus_cf.AAC.13